VQIADLCRPPWERNKRLKEQPLEIEAVRIEIRCKVEIDNCTCMRVPERSVFENYILVDMLRC
jgi:hypothetical protein